MPFNVYELARRYIARAPAAISGQSGHDQTFSVACSLVKGFDLSISEARPLLQQYNQRCEPPWSAVELEHKLQSADAAADSDIFGNVNPRGWLLRQQPLKHQASRVSSPIGEAKATFSSDKLRRFAARYRNFVNTAWLADRSPVNPYRLSAEGFLRALYTPNEKVIIFTDQKTQGQALWPNEKIPTSAQNGIWFLVQPVDGKFHPNFRRLDKQSAPMLSRRSEESVTDWRFLVLESDHANPHDWMGALVQWPLAISAIYTSGRRSIHALVRVDAFSLDAWRRFAREVQKGLVTLGADRQVVATAVRLSRLPGCHRGTRLQKLLYLNPNPEAKPITMQPRVRDVLRAALDRAHATQLGAGDVIEKAKAKNLNEAIAALDAHEALKAGGSRPVIELLNWFESAPAARAALSILTQLPSLPYG